jgi:hypothetical protein
MCLKKLRKKTVGYITQNLIKGERFIQSEKKLEYNTELRIAVTIGVGMGQDRERKRRCNTGIF